MSLTNTGLPKKRGRTDTNDSGVDQVPLQQVMVNFNTQEMRDVHHSVLKKLHDMSLQIIAPEQVMLLCDFAKGSQEDIQQIQRILADYKRIHNELHTRLALETSNK